MIMKKKLRSSRRIVMVLMSAMVVAAVPMGNGITVKAESENSSNYSEVSNFETKTEAAEDGTKTETKTGTTNDGANVEIKTVTYSDGSTQVSEKVSKADGTADLKITNTSEDGKKCVLITGTYDANGSLVKINDMQVSQQITGKKMTVLRDDIRNPILQLVDGTKNNGQNLTISLQACDASGNVKYTISVTTSDLFRDGFVTNTKVDSETGLAAMTHNWSYVLYHVNSKGQMEMNDAKKNKVTVSKVGDLIFDIASTGDYKLIGANNEGKVNRKILATVKAKKSKISLEKGQKTTFAFAKNCNKANIAKISYTTSNQNVIVNKNGVIEAMKAGSAVVTAKVTLKNGSKKTVTMNVKVK